jgi:hypothetical protein
MIWEVERRVRVASPNQHCLDCPSRSRATAAGALISGTATQQNIRYKPSRLPVCFRYYLGRGREADVW